MIIRWNNFYFPPFLLFLSFYIHTYIHTHLSPSLFLGFFFLFLSFRKKLGQEPWQELELERENGVARKSTNAKRTSVRVQETVCEARVAAEQYVPVHCPSFRPSSQSFTWLFLPVRGHNERFLARTPLFPHRDAPRFVPMPGPSAHLHGQVSGNLFPPRFPPSLPRLCIPSYSWWNWIFFGGGGGRRLTTFDDVWFEGSWRPMILRIQICQIYFFVWFNWRWFEGKWRWRSLRNLNVQTSLGLIRFEENRWFLWGLLGFISYTPWGYWSIHRESSIFFLCFGNLTMFDRWFDLTSLQRFDERYD